MATATKQYPTAEPFLPPSSELGDLEAAAMRCEGCNLYRDATQTVFGQGPDTARLMLVGEQPGDAEDRAGEPFVGPAGRLLDKAVIEAGIDRAGTYVTNAVKHFRWKSTGSGKRRIHAKPDAAHITACRPWLSAEIDAVRPEGIVTLGATAAQSIFGPSFRLTQHRGEVLTWPPAAGPFANLDNEVQWVVATIHPSAVLRADDREAMYAGLVADLRLAAERLAG